MRDYFGGIIAINIPGSRSIIGVEDSKLYPIRGQAILVKSPQIHEFLAVEGSAYVCKQGR